MKRMENTETKTGLVVIALLLGIFVASMDNTIVATAMATIVADLGGLKQFVWVTSAYMVAEMAGMPIFGKLSDMYGRKRFFLFGMIVFLLGSVLCGMAQTIVQLSIFRAIQGIGGGALVPIAFTIMFDIFPPEKRGKMGGLFGAVFGLSSIFGPLLGAYITDYLNWRWVFYINIPLGIVAFLLLWIYYRESPKHSKQSIDWLGVMTLVPAIVCLMFALELGGQKYDWDSAVIIGLFSAFALLFLAFLYVETKAQEPIVSYHMFRERLFASTTLVAFFSGATFVVATVYIPIFIQGVTGGSATNSGLILLPMMLSTTVSAQLGGFLAGKTSYRNVMFGFMLLFAAGIGLLGTIDEHTTRLTVTLYMIIVGLGVGASFSVLGMAAIHHFSGAGRGQLDEFVCTVARHDRRHYSVWNHSAKLVHQSIGRAVSRHGARSAWSEHSRPARDVVARSAGAHPGSRARSFDGSAGLFDRRYVFMGAHSGGAHDRLCAFDVQRSARSVDGCAGKSK